MENRQAVDAALAGIPVLSYDTFAASCYAQIRVKLEREEIPVDDPDMMIGAHAVAAGCILVTNNIKHFERMGIPLENWVENR